MRLEPKHRAVDRGDDPGRGLQEAHQELREADALAGAFGDGLEVARRARLERERIDLLPPNRGSAGGVLQLGREHAGGAAGEAPGGLGGMVKNICFANARACFRLRLDPAYAG